MDVEIALTKVIFHSLAIYGSRLSKHNKKIPTSESGHTKVDFQYGREVIFSQSSESGLPIL